jgi:selenocysteine lyase/cysteine desulfurase
MRLNARDLFNLTDDVAYFNLASVAPLMRGAADAIAAGARLHSQPWLIEQSHWFDHVEERRQLFAQLIGADAEGIALVPSVSYGLAVAARNLKASPGSTVVMPAEEFPSNVYTWRAFARRTGAQFVTVAREPGQSWTDAILGAIDERTAVVSVPNVHWTNAALFDLVAISRKCREAGAQLAVDASQSLGALPLDLAAVQPDFLVAVGYKWLLGPYGMGYLYVAPKHREGEPLEETWIAREGSEDFARLVDYVDRYRPGASRYDVGERTAFELTPAATVALKQLNAWGIPAISSTLQQITGQIERRAEELGLVVSDKVRGPHMLGLKTPTGGAAAVKEILRIHGVQVGFRGTSIRVAPHVYTNDADFERLFAAMEQIASL